MLSNELELTLRKALTIATTHEHEYATYEHLLLALTDDIDAKKLFQENGIIIESIKKKLDDYLKKSLVELVDKNHKEAKPTAGFQRIVQRAALHSQASGHKIINGTHVLAEFFFEHEAYALACLREEGLLRQDVLNYLKKEENFNSKKEETLDPKKTSQDQSEIITLIEDQDKLKHKQKLDNSTNSSNNAPNNDNNIEKYCVNLNEKATANSIDCLIGRQDEVQRTIEILCRRKKK